MTTESKQDTPLVHRTGLAPLLGGAVAGAGAVVALALVAAVVDGSPAVTGAIVGGGLTLAVFLLGIAVVDAAAKALPAASLMVALLTYAVQLLVLAAVAAALEGSGLAGDELSRGWFAAGVIAVTLLWMVGQVVAAARQRIPAFAEAPAGHHPGGER